MRDLVGRCVEEVVDVLIIVQAEDEPRPFRKRDGVRERLGEGLVARKLDDPDLAVLIRTEVGAEIVERLLNGIDYPVDVVGVGFMIVDLDRHILPSISPDGVVGG